MDLYIAEKPSLAKDLAKALGDGQYTNGATHGNGWTVVSCFGHMYTPFNPHDYRDEWENWALKDLPMIPDQWQINERKDAKKQLSIIKKQLKKATCVVNAGDPDREGQLLIDELLEECDWRGETKRVWIQSETHKGIQHAIGTMTDNSDYEGLYQSGLARQRADWLIGMNLTRAYTLKAQASGYQGVLSVGRVQTPTLALVAHRDNLISNFKPVDFFEIETVFNHEKGHYIGKFQYPDDWTDESGRLLDQKKANELLSSLTPGLIGNIHDVQKKSKESHQPLPYTMTTLQAAAAKRLNVSVSKVLEIAQVLKDKKLITYHRSENPYLDDHQWEMVPEVIAALSKEPSLDKILKDADYAIKSKAWNTKKTEAKSHHGIIPTEDSSRLSELNEAEKTLYIMIAERYLIQFYPVNIIQETTLLTITHNFTFKSSGFVTLQEGWKRLLGKESNDKPLIDINDGDQVSIEDSDLISFTTTPPKPFTQSTLVVAMENIAKYIEDIQPKKILKNVSGIGTVTTRGKIIDTLIKRNFLEMKKSRITSTSTGREFLQVLEQDIKSPIKTAKWEFLLSKIENDQYTLDQFMNEQEIYIQKIINNIGEVKMTTQANEAEIQITCPTCKEGHLRKLKGKYGLFWSCSRYKQGCKANFKNSRGKPVLEPKEKAPILEAACPSTECDGQAKQLKKKKGGGKFWICKTCEEAGRHHFHNDENDAPVLQEVYS